MRCTLALLALVALTHSAIAEEAVPQQSCDSHQAQLLEAERMIAQLQQQVEKSEASKVAAEEKIASLSGELATVTAHMKSVEAEVARVSESKDAGEQAQKECSAELASQTAQNKDLRAKLAAASSAECPSAAAQIQETAEEYVRLAASASAQALETAQTKAAPIVADASTTLGAKWSELCTALKALYSENLAATVDPAIAPAVEAVSQAFDRVMDATKDQRSQLCAAYDEAARVVKAKSAEWLSAAAVARTHFREQVIATVQKEHRLAGHGTQLVNAVEYSALAIAFLLVGIPLLRLAVGLTRRVISTTLSTVFCILTLGWCCGACSRGSAKPQPASKPKKKRSKGRKAN